MYKNQERIKTQKGKIYQRQRSLKVTVNYKSRMLRKEEFVVYKQEDYNYMIKVLLHWH